MFEIDVKFSLFWYLHSGSVNNGSSDGISHSSLHSKKRFLKHFCYICVETCSRFYYSQILFTIKSCVCDGILEQGYSELCLELTEPLHLDRFINDSSSSAFLNMNNISNFQSFYMSTIVFVINYVKKKLFLTISANFDLSTAQKNDFLT